MYLWREIYSNLCSFLSWIICLSNIKWFQIGKGVHQGCILSLCLFNLNAECIMQNAEIEEAQAGIRISQEKYQ